MKSLLTRRLELVEDVIEYYRHHPRCMDYNDEEDYWFPRFSGATLKMNTDGDVLGRLLAPTSAARLDTEGEICLEDLWDRLPEEVLDLGKYFLTELCCLHDSCIFWEGRELSELGKEFVEEIKIKFIK